MLIFHISPKKCTRVSAFSSSSENMMLRYFVADYERFNVTQYWPWGQSSQNESGKVEYLDPKQLKFNKHFPI